LLLFNICLLFSPYQLEQNGVEVHFCMLKRIEHRFTSIKNLIEPMCLYRTVKHQEMLKLVWVLKNVRSMKGLPKMGNPIGKVMTKIKKTEKGAEVEAQGVQVSPPSQVYLKALPLRDLGDVDMVKREVKEGNILILKVSPLAKKSIDDVKKAVSELLEFTQLVGGDIARLGEERVVITPSFIRIWREKTVAPKGALPTAA